MNANGLIVGSLATVLLGLTGCDILAPTQPKQEIAQSKPAAVVLTDVPLVDVTQNLKLSDLLLGRSNDGMINTNGDMRPFWIVSGRVENTTDSPVKNIRLQVRIGNKDGDTDLDSAVLILKDEVPPYSTVSFKRAVQLLLPEKGWAWNCYVLDATTQAYR
jgi:hypothetical protein